MKKLSFLFALLTFMAMAASCNREDKKSTQKDSTQKEESTYDRTKDELKEDMHRAGDKMKEAGDKAEDAVHDLTN